MGFQRGFLTELFGLIGLVSATALACNFHEVVAGRISSWLPLNTELLNVIAFLLVFGLATAALVYLVARRMAGAMKWQAAHWLVQSLGLALGAVRGLWWAGVLLLVFLGTGLGYAQHSVLDRSRLGAQVAALATDSIARVADWFPGHEHRGQLIPGLETPTRSRLKRRAHATDGAHS